MHQIVEAIVDSAGRIVPQEPVRFPEKCRVYIFVLDEDPYRTRTCNQGETPIQLPHQYRIDQPIRSGGMGQTYIGTDLQTGQLVCIKVLRPGIRTELFVQEWKTLSRINTCYVVRFLDRFEVGGVIHLVMDYVCGPTLSELLKTGLSTDECIWLGLCLMRGLHAFHELDVIHCDLKPDNVLIQESSIRSPEEPGWIPKIIDFGLAVLDEQDADGNLTAWGRIAGTPAYMAPEQVRGMILSPACDVYAAGLIL